MDTSIAKYASKMIIVIVCASAVMMAAGFIFLRPYYAVGFALGVGVVCILNIVKVYMLRFTVGRVVGMETSAASGFTGVMYLARFLLTGLVLVGAHFLPRVDLFGAAIGLLAMPIASYAINFFVKRDEKNRAAAIAEDEEVIAEGRDD